VGHEAQDVAGPVDQAGDVVQRAIGIVGVAEDHLALALDAGKGVGVREEGAFAIAHSHHHLAAAAEGAGEAGVRPDNVQLHGLADVLQRRIPQEGARQEAGLAEHLEAIADADNGHAPVRRLAHLGHDRRQGRHGAAAQVVAIGEAARQDDQVQALRQGCLGVPDHVHGGPGGALHRDLAVPVAVGARKDDDGGLHGQDSSIR